MKTFSASGGGVRLRLRLGAPAGATSAGGWLLALPAAGLLGLSTAGPGPARGARR